MGRGIEVFLLVILGVLLFGAKRLPEAARALGESLHLFKKAIRDESTDASGTTIRQVSGETDAERAAAAAAAAERARSAGTQQGQPERGRGTDPGA
jgi:sec-independent protein translocase protein TatA